MRDREDRAARRAYRRSLPPQYRWRRVVTALVVVALSVVSVVWVGPHPRQWARDRWFDLRNQLVVVSLRAAVDPLNASAAGTSPQALVDGTTAPWSMPWSAGSAGDGCQRGTVAAQIMLTFQAARIRRIYVDAGLAANDPERELQFHPRELGVSFDGGPCHRVPLKNDAAAQDFPLDSDKPVRQALITVESAYPAPATAQNLLSITEIRLAARPT